MTSKQLISYLGYAIIQIPEMVLYMYGCIKRRWLNLNSFEMHTPNAKGLETGKETALSEAQLEKNQKTLRTINVDSHSVQDARFEVLENSLRELTEKWEFINKKLENVESK